MFDQTQDFPAQIHMHKSLGYQADHTQIEELQNDQHCSDCCQINIRMVGNFHDFRG